MRRLVAEDRKRTKRANGAGSVRTKTRPGKPPRFQALGPQMDGRRDSFGCYDSWEAANEAREAGLIALEKKSATGGATLPGVTLRARGERWLGERDHDTPQSATTYRRRWKCLESAPFIDDPIRDVDPLELEDFLRKLARTRPGQASGLKVVLSGVYREAKRARLVEHNPIVDLRLPKQVRTHEPWTYLLPEEQRALVDAPGIPETDLLQIRFALYSGVREGEQFSLRRSDVHLDRACVVIRYGSLFGPPKGKKIRTCHLNQPALAVLTRWLELLDEYCPPELNQYRLVFPGKTGGYQGGHPLQTWVTVDGKRKRICGLDLALAAAGIASEKRHDGKRPRWHDLRHTCASSLTAGWWGEPWRLEEVQRHLGHATITETQKYAHLAPSVITEKARRTTGLGSSLVLTAKNTGESAPSRMKAINAGSSGDRRAGGLREPTGNQIERVRDLGRAALEATAARDPFAVHRLVEAVEAALVLADLLAPEAQDGEQGARSA